MKTTTLFSALLATCLLGYGANLPAQSMPSAPTTDRMDLLDMANGAVDGTPPLPNKQERRRWAAVCSEAYTKHRTRVELGWPTLMDSYGATNEAEFFAVATEQFFTAPTALRRFHPDLYAVLSGFYRQDPAARAERAHDTR